jgi:TolB-like protein
MFRPVFHVFLFLFSVSFAFAEKIPIAVIDLDAQGVEKSTAAVVTERLRSELVVVSVFRVMERAQMENILKEQGFQQTGACSDNQCLVAVGQVLGVKRMITGSVGKVGDLYSLTLRIIDVATGEILGVASEDCECSLKIILGQTIPSLAQKISREFLNESRKKQGESGFGDIHITTDPPGASVSINGTAIDGVTPLTKKNLPIGEHEIFVQKGNLIASKRITLMPNDLLNIELTLEAGSTLVKIFSDPAGAEISLDGRTIGKTPCKIGNFPTGKHDVTAKKNGYFLQKIDITPSIGKQEEVNITLVPCGYVTVKVAPENARIEIAGKNVENGMLVTLPVGSHKISVSAPRFSSVEKEVTISQGKEILDSVFLSPMYGTLSVTAIPNGSDISINGIKCGYTPYKGDLDSGTYDLVAGCKNYADTSLSILLHSGEQKYLAITLHRTPEYLLAQKQQKQRVVWTFRGIIAIAAIGGLAGGIYYNNEYDKSYNTYKSINVVGDHSAEYRAAEQRKVWRNVLYGLSAVGACSFGLTFFFK